MAKFTNEQLQAFSARPFKLNKNYIYLHHVDKFIIIPSYPETVQDSLQSTFSQTNPLARSAPIFSYSHSGPRQLTVNLNLHRDEMTQINYAVSNMEVELGDDYIDTMIKQLQAIALPQYASANKMVNPPMVSLRLGNEIFIRGVVQGGINVTYKTPILDNDKYALVDIGFNILEVDPYDAETVMEKGSFRGLDTSLDRRINQI